MTKASPMKITYATMGAEQLDELHRELDRAMGEAPAMFGREHPMSIGGKSVRASEQFDDRSPIDTRMLLGRFQQGTREHVHDAISSARHAYRAWSARPWQERVQLLRNVADAIRRHRWELSVLMGYETGKNRLECVG
ncbi:MAG: aldehyde dehydrogenase family protein, partial [Vicinamibacterales bacterium]